MVLIKSMQKTTHFCLDSTPAPLARSQAGVLKGRKGWSFALARGGRGASYLPMSITSHDNLKAPPVSSKPHILHVMEGRQSPVPISEKFTDNKAECILQGWTFSPRMSHYQVLIMLISQPLESCPAFHRQKWEQRVIVVGGCTLPDEILTICSQL